MNPLSDVMGGWGIWETVNGEQKLTTECIENVIMMVPFSSVVMWTFGEKIGNGWKKILWQSGKIAFIFSVSIEMLQLLLRLLKSVRFERLNSGLLLAEGVPDEKDTTAVRFIGRLYVQHTVNNNAVLEKGYTAFNKCVDAFCLSIVALIVLTIISIFLGL